MQKPINKNDFFSNVIKSLEVSNKIKLQSMELLKILLYFDPYNLTTFEFSFKVKNNKINKEIRFLNMDADAYSCKSKKLFLKRTKLFDNILKRKCKNNKVQKVISALKSISNTPMDLYFGADIQDDDYVFGFWLIFGGVKRDGKVNFWDYDFGGIISRTLETAGLKKNKNLKDNILNLGFDMGRDFLMYKVYYLCKEKIMKNSVFEQLMKDINLQLKDFKYFYFWSEMYDERGRLVKEKLFIEFLEDIFNAKEELINRLLNNISQLRGIHFNPDYIKTKLRGCGGRISLISFELDGTVTFYIRPD